MNVGGKCLEIEVQRSRWSVKRYSALTLPAPLITESNHWEHNYLCLILGSDFILLQSARHQQL